MYIINIIRYHLIHIILRYIFYLNRKYIKVLLVHLGLTFMQMHILLQFTNGIILIINYGVTHFVIFYVHITWLLFFFAYFLIFKKY